MNLTKELELQQLSVRAFAFSGVPFRREEIAALTARLAEVIAGAIEEAAERRRQSRRVAPADLDEAKRVIAASRAPEE